MRFGKAICGVTAVLTLLSSVAITAQAEETEQLKLLTAKFSEANGASSLFNFQSGYFVPYGEGDDKSKFFHIGEKELAEWRETGKFTFTNVESDFDMDGFDHWSGDFNGEYVQFYKEDASGNITERQVVHLDKATGKISKAYTMPADWCYTKPNGYSLSFDVSGSELSVNVYDPSGKKTTTVLKYTGEGELYYSGGSFDGGENMGYVLFVTKQYAKTDDFPFESADYEIYAVKKNGELELTHKTEKPFVSFGYMDGVENGVMWFEGNPPKVEPSYIYSTENNKRYTIESYFYFDNGSLRVEEFADKLYGTKAIIKGTHHATADGANQTGYVLVNLRDNNSAEAISNLYKSISTEDGKIYLVQTLDDKWGYIDSNGKELAIFDDASSFFGDYAPVVKDGKAYLIDRNMNKVSEVIDGTGVTTLSDGLYRVAINDSSALLVTYANNSTGEPTSEPTCEPTSEPTSSTSSTTTSETTSSTTSEPTGEPVSTTTSSTAKPEDGSNPPTGAALALLPIAAVCGAVAVVTRKRRK